MQKFLSFLAFFIPVILIIFGLFVAGFALCALFDNSETLQCFCPSCPATAFTQKGAMSLGLIKVDIQGAVKKPGIYQLEIGQRLADLIASASGFLEDADRAYIAKNLNLATELKDQAKIYIPFEGENESESSTNSADKSGASGSILTGLISINQADSQTLQSLSGIGEAKAEAIIENRPYSSLDELVSKKVISENLFNSLKAVISL